MLPTTTLRRTIYTLSTARPQTSVRPLRDDAVRNLFVEEHSVSLGAQRNRGEAVLLAPSSRRHDRDLHFLGQILHLYWELRSTDAFRARSRYEGTRSRNHAVGYRLDFSPRLE